MQVNLSKSFVCFTTVDRGFQRGGSLLGFPTANLRLTPSATRSLRALAMNTVWAGYAAVDAAVSPTALAATKPAAAADGAITHGAAATSAASSHAAVAALSEPLSPSDTRVFPCVFSIGDNPHFKNVELTLEVHILHKFTGDFYAHGVRLLGVAPFRGMTPFTGIDALIAQIHDDIRVATEEILPLPSVQALRAAAFPSASTAAAPADTVESEPATTGALGTDADKLQGLFSTALGAPVTMFFDWIEKRGPAVAATL